MKDNKAFRIPFITKILWKIRQPLHQIFDSIALSYPPRVRVKATVKLSATFFHEESSITKGDYDSAIAPKILWNLNTKYIEVPQFSIVTHPFLMFHLFQKCLNTQVRTKKWYILNSVDYHHPCLSRIASRLTLTFIRHLTLTNI